MIKAYIYRNNNNEIFEFKVINHGDSIVCSAVSILTLNTVNSIESFTNAEFFLDYDENGGFINCCFPSIKNGGHISDVNLLLNSMVLGLKGIEESYKKNIKVYDK